MRHFRSREFAPSLAVPCLPNRVQPPSTELRLVTRPCAPNRVAPLLAGAVRAEPPAAITARAESKLDAAPPAGDKPKKFRRQEAPCRRFLDMELRLWSNVRTPRGVFWPELQKARSWRSGPSLISADALSTTTRPTWPRSRLVIGEPRPASPRGFHRTYADREARSQPSLFQVDTAGRLRTLPGSTLRSKSSEKRSMRPKPLDTWIAKCRP